MNQQKWFKDMKKKNIELDELKVNHKKILKIICKCVND